MLDGLFYTRGCSILNNMQLQKILATFLIFAVSLSFFYPFSEVKAAIPPIQPLTKPFGGKITKIQACMSPSGFILYIGPPVGGKFFLNPATSQIKSYGVIRPGICTLGYASPAPINCDKGNPSGIGGFSIGGLLGSAVAGGLVDANVVTMEMIEPGNIFGSQIMGVELVGPGGALFVGGDLGIQLAGLAEGLGGLLPGINIISSLASGNFLGAGLSLAGIFVPVIGPAISIASFIFSALGINFGKKPPSLGSAYPIIQIGTTQKPVPPGICPQIPFLEPAHAISTP